MFWCHNVREFSDMFWRNFLKYSQCYITCVPPGGDLPFGFMFTESFESLTMIYRAQFGKLPDSFLDVGCADGRMMTHAQKLGVRRVYGIDNAKYPHARHENIEIVSVSNYRAQEQFDLCWVNAVLPYLSEKSVANALKKLNCARMIIAKHYTYEDLRDSWFNFDTEGMLSKDCNWWLVQFQMAGFQSWYDKCRECFVAVRG